jgi:hypothetical protein
MYLVEVIFYAGKRHQLPSNGYRPDAVFAGQNDYWGITFIDLPINEFDVPTPAKIAFTFQDRHYDEINPNQLFKIMEGPLQVGEGKILSDAI